MTARVDRDVPARAKQYAEANDAALSRLVFAFLQRAGAAGDPLADAPTVRRLSEILVQDASIEDYHQYVKEKHAG